MVTMRRVMGWLLVVLIVAGCGGNPYLDASLKPAEFEGKDKAWFEKNWGPPSGKSPRFFGGEKWTYYRIAGGTARVLGGINPHQCEIELYFDKDGKLDSYDYSSGC